MGLGLAHLELGGLGLRIGHARRARGAQRRIELPEHLIRVGGGVGAGVRVGVRARARARARARELSGHLLAQRG